MGKVSRLRNGGSEVDATVYGRAASGVEFKMSNHWFDRLKSRSKMLHRNSLKHYVHLFNNFTDISEERQQLKQLSWRVSKKAL